MSNDAGSELKSVIEQRQAEKAKRRETGSEPRCAVTVDVSPEAVHQLSRILEAAAINAPGAKSELDTADDGGLLLEVVDESTGREVLFAISAESARVYFSTSESPSLNGISHGGSRWDCDRHQRLIDATTIIEMMTTRDQSLASSQGQEVPVSQTESQRNGRTGPQVRDRSNISQDEARVKAPSKRRPWRIAKKIAKRHGYMTTRGRYTVPLVTLMKAQFQSSRLDAPPEGPVWDMLRRLQG